MYVNPTNFSRCALVFTFRCSALRLGDRRRRQRRQKPLGIGHARVPHSWRSNDDQKKRVTAQVVRLKTTNYVAYSPGTPRQDKHRPVGEYEGCKSGDPETGGND
jgi:hypothetical protein